MNSGHYFHIDINSDFANGTVMFRYNRITGIDSENKIKYPIYITICKYSIDFYVHFTKLDKNHNDDKSPNRDKKGDTSIKHQNVNILNLPLSNDFSVNNSLTNVLRNSFNKHFCFFKNPCKKDKNKQNDKNPCNFCNSESNCLKEKLNTQPIEGYHSFFGQNSDQGRFLFLRMLILDFIFDWNHSQIFKNSPYYEIIDTFLKSHFFFSAISAKAEYEYLKSKWNSLNKSKQEKDADESEIITAILFQAEKKWHQIILDKNASLIINKQDSGGWFDFIEREHRNIFRSKDYKWTKLKIRKYIKIYCHQQKQSSEWFMKRYALGKAYKVHLFGLNPILLFILSLLITFYLYPFNKSVITSIPQVSIFLLFSIINLNLLRLPIKWYIIFFVKKKHKIPCKKNKIIESCFIYASSIELFMPRLIMAITSAWFLFGSFLSRWGIMLNCFNELRLFIFSLVVIFLILLLFMREEVDQLTYHRIHYIKSLLRVLVVLLFSLIFSFFVGIITTNLFFEVIKSGNNQMINEIISLNSPSINFFWTNFKLYNNMLLFYSPLAVFVGIFLNLIFDSKAVTSSLSKE